MTWSITALALLGVWLNIHKYVACFWIWMFTNAAWAAVDWHAGIPAQAALHAIYFGLAIYGIRKWSRGGHHGFQDSR